MKKTQALDVFQQVEDTIAEFGVESMQLADLFMTIDDSVIGAVFQKDDDLRVRFDLPTDKGLTRLRASALDWYLFSDSSLTEEHVEQVRRAFSCAIPRWMETNPETLASVETIFANAAYYYDVGGDVEKWEAFSKRILDMYKTHLGSMHKIVMHLLADMGAHYLRFGSLDEADACFREARTICESYPDSKISESPWLLMNSASVAFFRGEIVTARLLLDEVMERLQQAPVMDQVVLLETLVNYAAIFRALTDGEAFDRVSLEAEEVAKEAWKLKPLYVVTSALALIRSNEALGRYDVAERLSQWLLDAMESTARAASEIREHGSVWAIFFNNCVENGVPASIEKINPEIMSEISDELFS